VILGIDAFNIRVGGGVTHLREILRVADPSAYGFKRVIVWSAERTLEELHARPWLERASNPALNGGVASRTHWHLRYLAHETRNRGCNILFSPGGVCGSKVKSLVALSQNLLPFDWNEVKRYGLSTRTFKMLWLRHLQTQTFRKADGVVFLTKYAQTSIRDLAGPFRGAEEVIPHGVNATFRSAPKVQRPIGDYSLSRPYRITYVSIVELYKHQVEVVRAVSALRQSGYPVVLDLIGPAYGPALANLKNCMQCEDPEGKFVNYRGPERHEQIAQRYREADMFVFASSCENMPNILIEAMAAGLPIACSDRGPMPEILDRSGAYFNPEESNSIQASIESLLLNPKLRADLADGASHRAAQYSWEKCANATFAFLRRVAESRKLETHTK
jgi:glycosyltransferase involved in cell wall biosynthesis